MNKKAKSAHDAFTFSLGGQSTKSSFVLMPAIADDRIDKTLDEKSRRSQSDQPGTGKELKPAWGRFWLRGRRRAA